MRASTGLVTVRWATLLGASLAIIAGCNNPKPKADPNPVRVPSEARLGDAYVSVAEVNRDRSEMTTLGHALRPNVPAQVTVRVTVHNRGNGQVTHIPWTSPPSSPAKAPYLVDGKGVRHELGPTKPGKGSSELGTVLPGRNSSSELVFPGDIDPTQRLELGLAAENVGGEGTIRFEIPPGFGRFSP